eukprot:1706487-Prymnesium_polylepis.1
MQPGWEKHYVDYNAIKDNQVEAVIAQPSKAATEAFLAAITSEIAKSDAFVQLSTETLRTEFDALCKASSSLTDFEAKVTKLRHFVALNVIAATKIVKKHDKHAGDAMSQRSTVANLVYASSGIQSCRMLHADLVAALGVTPSNELSPAEVQIDMGEDESEPALRALPNWLLKDLNDVQAETQTKAPVELYSRSFYTTFLTDWTMAG